MKRWRKWIDVIFAIATLLALFCSYFLIFDYGKITTTLDNYNKQGWFYYFLTVVAILGALLALYVFIRALALPTINNYIIDKDDSGEMLITSSAILDNVLTTLSKHPEIRNADAVIKVKNGRSNEINTEVKCGVYEGENLNSLGQMIKEDIAKSLETFTGYPVNKVDVEFYDIKKDSNKRVV